MIDCFRLRLEDEYRLDGNAMTGSVYDKARTSVRAFRDFIKKAAQVQDFFPPW